LLSERKLVTAVYSLVFVSFMEERERIDSTYVKEEEKYETISRSRGIIQ
jgi:hypothetical protein